MNRNELVAKFRDESDDDVSASYTWEDETVVSLLNDSIEEACRRKSLIFDSSTEDVCVIEVTAGTAIYPLHQAIDYITKAYITDVDGAILSYLYMTERDVLDNDIPEWRELDPDTPSYLVVDEINVQVVPVPSEDCILKLEVYRVPLDTEKMSIDDIPPVDPETIPTVPIPIIASNHHRYLHHWALSVAYNKRNMDKYDPQRSEYHLQKFEDYFGPAVEAKRLRDSRSSIPHHNQVYP